MKFKTICLYLIPIKEGDENEVYLSSGLASQKILPSLNPLIPQFQPRPRLPVCVGF